MGRSSMLIRKIVREFEEKNGEIKEEGEDA